MIIRIKDIKLLNNYNLLILFDDNKQVIYDMNNDIETLPNYDYLKKKKGLWEQVKLDKSRTCVYWNDLIDLPSDILYEYGKEI